MLEMGCTDLMHYFLNLELFFFLDLLKTNAFIPAYLHLNQFHLELHQLLQLLLLLLLYIAFAVVTFSIIIAVTKFKAIIVVKMHVPDFGRFFGLNLILCCFHLNFDWGLVNSSLLYLIIVALSSTHCLLYFIDFYFHLQPDFKLLCLNFAGFVVGQVLINFKLLANRFHLQLAYHFHRKLEMGTTMDLFQIFASSLQLLPHRRHSKMVYPFYRGFQ